jgi:hypothetical protein
MNQGRFTPSGVFGASWRLVTRKRRAGAAKALVAVASVRPEGELEKGWVLAECNRLCDVVEAASAILGSVSTVERGATEIRHRYTQMRRDALSLLDEIRTRAES